MRKPNEIKGLPFLFLIPVFLFACQPEKKKSKQKLIIGTSSDANALNPLKARGETAAYLCMQVFQTLNSFDYDSHELIGVIAENQPKKTIINENQITFSYTIRKEAQFDSGEPIRAKDILFSLKLSICPEVSFPGASSFYSFIDSLVFEDPNSREIHFYCQNTYFLNSYATGDFYILPRSTYDSLDILSQYSIAELKALNPDSLPEDILAFAELFNQSKFDRNPDYIDGSGPYDVESWTSNERIVLKLKSDWWGAKLNQENSFFEAYPANIQYEIIPDKQTALNAFQTGAIDLLKGINPKDFAAIEESKKYQSASSRKMGYQYIGFNLSKPVIDQLEFRKAFACLVNKDELINQVYYGLGRAIHSPIPDYDTARYNSDLIDIVPDPSESIAILDQMGAIDRNEDGIRELEIAGHLHELRFEFLYNSNNEQRKRIGLILQDKAKSIGIEIIPVGVEFSVYLERIRSGDFDLFYGSINNSPIPPDYNRYFHSSNVEGGRNYFNYSSVVADSIITAIQESRSETERNKYYKAFQKQIQTDLPLLFITESVETFLISSAIHDFKISPVRPNYWAPSVKIEEE